MVAPPTLLPVGVESWPVTVAHDLDAALPGTDAVMMLRVQAERMHGQFFPSAREYAIAYGLNEARLTCCPNTPWYCTRDRCCAGWRSRTRLPTHRVRRSLNRSVTECMCGWLCSTTCWQGQGIRRDDQSSCCARVRPYGTGEPVDLLIRRWGDRRDRTPRRAGAGAEAIDGEGSLRCRVWSTCIPICGTWPGGRRDDRNWLGGRGAGWLHGGVRDGQYRPGGRHRGDHRHVCRRGGCRTGRCASRRRGHRRPGGERLAEMGTMANSAAAVRMFSDDGLCVHDSLRDAPGPGVLRRVRRGGGPTRRGPRLTAGAQAHEGEGAARLGPGRPARRRGGIRSSPGTACSPGRWGALHICHCPRRGRWKCCGGPRSSGSAVSAEVTPHHSVAH